MKDDTDWLWHDATGADDPYLPMESRAHDYYIYLNTSSPEVQHFYHCPSMVENVSFL